MFKKRCLEEKRQEILFKEFWHFTPVGWNDFIKFGEFWIPIPALFVELKKNGKKIWKFLAYVSPFGPAVWPTRGNIYTNVLFYYIDETLIFQFYFDIFLQKMACIFSRVLKGVFEYLPLTQIFKNFIFAILFCAPLKFHT